MGSREIEVEKDIEIEKDIEREMEKVNYQGV